MMRLWLLLRDLFDFGGSSTAAWARIHGRIDPRPVADPRPTWRVLPATED